MKRQVLATAVATFLTVLAPATWAMGDSQYSDPAFSTNALRFDEGRKWQGDASLRRYMGEIRDTLALQRSTILSRDLTQEQAAQMGAAIEARVASILTYCNLSDRAAHNMHLVMADLVQAADILQGRARGKPVQGAGIALRAVQMYATYFDHPGWKPVL